LEEIEKVGRVRRVEGAGWDLNLGAITHLNNWRGAPSERYGAIPAVHRPEGQWAPGLQVASQGLTLSG